MPDTIRTLAALNTQFADNTQGIIAPQDMRDLFVSMMVYGEIGSGAKSSITLGTGFQALDFTVAGSVGRGLTIDTTNKLISAVPVAMKAWITLEIAFRGTLNTTYDFAVIQNPSGIPVDIARLDISQRILNAAQIATFTVTAAIQLAANDSLQAQVRSNGAAFELLRGALRVQRIAIE